MPRPIGDPFRRSQMRVEFAGGGMHVGDRRAGELELAARLDRDRAAFLRRQTDDVAGIEDRLPAGLATDAFQQRPDAAVARIGNRFAGLGVEGDLLVLGADREGFARLLAGREPVDQFDARGERCRIGHVARHALPRREIMG